MQSQTSVREMRAHTLCISHTFLCLWSRSQVMKTYHVYNTDSINAESKLKEAEKQEEKQMGRSGRQDDRQTPRSPDALASIKTEDKHVRRSSVKKIEKMKEKVRRGLTCGRCSDPRGDGGQGLPVGLHTGWRRCVFLPSGG